MLKDRHLALRKKFGKDTLQLDGVSYDQIIVIEFLDAPDVQADQAILFSTMQDAGWMNPNVLAVLGNYKVALEEEVAGLTERASKLGATNVFLLDFSDGCGATWEVCKPWADQGIARFADQQRQTCGMAFYSCFASSPDQSAPVVASDGFAPPHSNLLQSPAPRLSLVSGQCLHCGWGAGLVEQQTPYACVTLISSWCPNCGSTALGTGLTAWFYPAAVSLVFLAQFLLLEAISLARELLRLVIVAVAVLLSRLRTASVRYSITLSQRAFFTHHGAHPPRVQPPRASGLFLEKAFRLQPAF